MGEKWGGVGNKMGKMLKFVGVCGCVEWGCYTRKSKGKKCKIWKPPPHFERNLQLIWNGAGSDCNMVGDKIIYNIHYKCF